MTATYTFAVFSSLDGYGAPSTGRSTATSKSSSTGPPCMSESRSRASRHAG